MNTGFFIDLFKSPSKKRYELTIICQVNRDAAKSKIGKGLTSSVSHVPLSISVPFNLTSDELARLVGVFCFFSTLIGIKSERPRTVSSPNF